MLPPSGADAALAESIAESNIIRRAPWQAQRPSGHLAPGGLFSRGAGAMSVMDDIKQRLDIVQVIGATVQLKKAGRNFSARCPFHQEKTPSFVVFPDTQGWHCFGACATGGDIFTFVQKRDGIEFAEALRLLAEQAGVRLPERGHEEQAEAETARLLSALAAAADFYSKALQEAPAAEAARQYVASRGVTAETQAAFGLGFSLEGWDHLRRALGEIGYSDDDLVNAGLVIPTDNGVRDRFRGRLMFPLRDARGRVLGFGARSLDGSPPKYLNSPQNHLFDKGGMLYGLDRAREAIRAEKRAVIVEGYMDAIMAHQSGFSNVVASMGTALTERQVRLLKGLANQIVLALDADAAGQEATLRGVGVMTAAVERKTVPVPVVQETRSGLRGLVQYEQALDTEIRVAVLAGGKDPDEIIRQDPEAWRRLLDQSQPVLDFIMAAAVRGRNLSDPREKKRAAEQVFPYLLEVRDPILRSHYVQRLARRVEVDERALLARLAELNAEQLRKTRSAGQRQRPPDSGPPPEYEPDATGADETSGAAVKTLEPEPQDKLGEYTLALLLQHPECAPDAERLQADYFESHECRAVLAAWQAAGGLERLWDVLDPSLHEAVSELMSRPLPPAGEAQRRTEFLECQRRLEMRWYRRLKARQRHVFMEPGVDASEVVRLSYRLIQGGEAEIENADPDAAAQAEILRRGLEIDQKFFVLHHRRDDAPADSPHWQGDGNNGRAN